MCMIGIFKEFIKCTWCDLYLIGKILFLPLFILFGLSMGALACFELIVIDTWVMLIALTSKSISVIDVIETMLMID